MCALKVHACGVTRVESLCLIASLKHAAVGWFGGLASCRFDAHTGCRRRCLICTCCGHGAGKAYAGEMAVMLHSRVSAGLTRLSALCGGQPWCASCLACSAFQRGCEPLAQFCASFFQSPLVALVLVHAAAQEGAALARVRCLLSGMLPAVPHQVLCLQGIKCALLLRCAWSETAHPACASTQLGKRPLHPHWFDGVRQEGWLPLVGGRCCPTHYTWGCRHQGLARMPRHIPRIARLPARLTRLLLHHEQLADTLHDAVAGAGSTALQFVSCMLQCQSWRARAHVCVSVCFHVVLTAMRPQSVSFAVSWLHAVGAR